MTTIQMAARKSPAKPKEQLKPTPRTARGRLDPRRWEEIAAIAVFILAAFTGLGAFNLSGGILLDSWVHLLQTLLGWGVYFAPFLLFGLGVWLFLDSVDKIVDIGWERPIGLCLGYILLLAVLHWLSAAGDPAQLPGRFQGGGMIGWGVTTRLVQAFGAIGGLLALAAGTGVTLILLFNISLLEFFRRALSVVGILRNLSQKTPPIHFNLPRLGSRGLRPAPPRAIERGRVSIAPPPSTRQPGVNIAPARSELRADAPPRGGVAVRIIGSDAPLPLIVAASAPAIRREWRLPTIAEILEESSETEINQQEIRSRVRIIEEALQHFGVPAKVLEVNQGPAITQFGVEPGFVEQRGIDGKVHRVKVKVSRISTLQHDLELALAAAPIRIEAPVPGRGVVGIEVPNAQIALVSLRSVMESERFQNTKSKLRLALGQDVSGQPIVADLAFMPHLLIAGATGSGKSVCINSLVACLLCTATPAEVRFIMIDPKRVELVNFNGIPHLDRPVVVEVDGAVAALKQVVQEMERRFKLFAQQGARNIDIYNHMLEGKPDAEKLPLLVIIVDELADLMMVSPDEVERAITRLAQMARATGIHLILATQRPSVDVVTGLIKANFPSRISFAVTSQIDSRVVLDAPGAEKLLGRGDMLYMASDSSKLVRLQGCFVSDRELDRIVTHWKGFAPPPTPIIAPQEPAVQKTLWGESVPIPKDADAEDDLLPQAIAVVKQSNKASVSLLQRKLRIGYSRAARLIELLEEKGIVGPDGGPTKGRTVFAKDRAPQASRDAASAPGRLEPNSTLRAGAAGKSRSEIEFEEDDDFDDWTEEDWADLGKE